jgi:hypothetical protein
MKNVVIITKKIDTSLKIIKYKHRGSLGDIIYSLATIMSFGGGIFYLSKPKLNKNICRLIKAQPYIKYYGVLNKEDKLFIEVNMDEYRKENIGGVNPTCLAQAHFDITQRQLKKLEIDIAPQFDLTKSWLFNIKPINKAPIVINRTKRYHGTTILDWKLLNDYKSQCLFIGYPNEHDKMCKMLGFKIDYYEVQDAYEFAQIIAGSKLFIGNQSMGFAIAEGLKCPRILEVCDWRANCTPHGPNYFLELTNELIKKGE